MNEKRTKFHYTFSKTFNIASIYEDDRIICKDMLIEEETLDKIIDLLNELYEENEQLKNELRKEKSLREYSDSMYGADLIVNIRFSNGEWKADVSVIDDERSRIEN